MTDTPRTDRAERHLITGDATGFVSASFARRLERELKQANRVIKKIREIAGDRLVRAATEYVAKEKK